MPGPCARSSCGRGGPDDARASVPNCGGDPWLRLLRHRPSEAVSTGRHSGRVDARRLGVGIDIRHSATPLLWPPGRGPRLGSSNWRWRPRGAGPEPADVSPGWPRQAAPTVRSHSRCSSPPRRWLTISAAATASSALGRASGSPLPWNGRKPREPRAPLVGFEYPRRVQILIEVAVTDPG